MNEANRRRYSRCLDILNRQIKGMDSHRRRVQLRSKSVQTRSSSLSLSLSLSSSTPSSSLRIGFFPCSRLGWCWIGSWLIMMILMMITTVNGYPVILQVDEQSDRCLRFNIPDNEDAHLVVLALPNADEIADEAMETWYVDQVYQLIKSKRDNRNLIPQKVFDVQPEAIAAQYTKYLQERGNSNQSNLIVKITATPASDPDAVHFENKANYFLPVVLNNIRATTESRIRRHVEADDQGLEGFGICFVNTDEERQIQVIFDVVTVDEDIRDESDNESKFEKDLHLTPLEQSLDASISAANAVIREMGFMEKREQRMRQTADNINNRVRWFSYLSVSVLLVVTYIQVSYLKRYFRKKKLM